MVILLVARNHRGVIHEIHLSGWRPIAARRRGSRCVPTRKFLKVLSDRRPAIRLQFGMSNPPAQKPLRTGMKQPESPAPKA